MFTAITHSNLWVLDQDEALEFYVGKLGLEVKQDVPLGFMRWLTVGVPGDPSREILLELPAQPSLDEDSAKQVRELLSKGATGLAIGFTTDDCRKLYETLLARGVGFTQEPTQQAYGIDMGVRDPFGNQIRIVQPAAPPEA